MNHQLRIRPPFQLATRILPLLALGFLSIPTASAAPPDLTAPGVIAGIDRSSTYNLGPTGLRGWIYVTTGSMSIGANGTMTGESRQILVTVASAPANSVLAVDDVILGAMAASSGTVPNFTSDARKAFATALTAAEQTGGGSLRVKRWRAGAIADVNIPITILGNYTATAPYNCPKSALILANTRNKLVAQLKADANFLSNYWDGAISALALLSGVQPGDPDYTTVQTRLQTHARNLASAGPQAGSLMVWTWAYNTLFLAEYYLLTGDANVLPGIQSYTLKLAQSQSIYGTYGHDAALLRSDGSGRRVNIGYGPVNAAGIVANMAMVLGKKALLTGSQTVDPEITTAIQRGSDYFKFYVNKGSIPYGEHEPVPNWHASNGKDPMCAVLFGLQSGRATETEYYAHMSIAGYKGREYGHTGQGFSYLWGALGAHMGGALALAEHLKPVRWHLDLSRRTDGSFAYDGQEQYGGGSTNDGTYLGATGYYGLNPTATYLLTYSLPLQRLYITGKRDTPANPPALNLDASTVAHAIDAANFEIDCPTFTTTSLISSLSDYDPVVRHHAAVELGKRSATITPAELTTMRTMLTGTDANGRMGAAQALGLLKDSTSLPTLAQRLDKTTEPDLWVRAKAASAIREYTAATISTHRDAMLTAFVDNATDPDNIDWSDPIQTSNSYLSFALFGNAIYGGTHIGAYTINAPKNLLYPAIETGLAHPDSMPRSGVSQFCIDRLPLSDVQAVIPSFFKVVEYECLADRMWGADPRVDGIGTMSKYKISEGIPYALDMLEIPAGFEWGSTSTVLAGLNALATYGDAARWTLPTLKSYLGKWPSGPGEWEVLVYTTLVNTIATIENATTAPAQNPGLAVANSQILITTGPIAVTLTGSSPRSAVTFTNLIAPAHGTLTGTAPNLIYTPDPGYTGPDFFTFQVVDSLGASYPSTPGTVSLIVGSAGTGLKGEYFDNPDFTNPVLTRTDAKVDFDWGTGSPHASVGADTFSVRWTGVLLVPETGNYTFSSLSSEGMRLYVNGTLVIDNFTDQSTRWTDGTPIYLSKGQFADILIEYYENTGSAVAKLKWTGPSFAGANGSIIPQSYFFDGSTIPNRPAFAFSQNLSTDKNTALPITLQGSGGSLTYTLLTQPANGTLSGTAPNLTYTPNTNFTGTDSFTFFVNNGSTNSLPATVTIGVQNGPLTHFTWTTASGNWSDASKWTPGAPLAAGQANYALNFNASGVYTATHNLNSGFQLNQLNMDGNVTIDGTQSLSFVANGGSQPTVNHNGGALVKVVSPIQLAALTEFGGNVASSGKLELTKQITGTGGIVKNGRGKLCIYGVDNNNFSGGTIVNNGTLILSAYVEGLGSLNAINPLGTGPVTLNGATIELQRVSSANHPLTVNGGTLFSYNGWGATWSGPITINQTLTTLCTWPLTCSGTVSGPSGIIKTGTNTLTLSGTNSYTGTTEIREGTLTCNNSSSLGNGPLIITTPGKANLNFTGTRPIASLTLSGTVMPPGTYGSTASSATNKSDTYFSGNGTVTVLQATTTSLSLTSGTSPAASGSSLTFTATVTGSAPTGNVQFYDGTTLLGTSALNGSFQATFTTNQLAIGPHSITARYVGNSSNGSSNSAATAISIFPATPAAPTNLSATPGAANSSNISLSWTASAGASGYYVKRSTTNGGPYSILAYVTATTWQDTTATPGVSYYYVVSALNAAGEGAPSSQATAVVEYIGIVTSADTVGVPEGGTNTFQVRLSKLPPANVTVTLARNSGDADITITSATSLTFRTNNWNTWQTVTLAAASDADSLDSTATITCTPGNSSYLAKSITAIENDTHTTLTITNNGNGSTTPSGALTVAKGASNNISATPANSEYLFGNWSVTSGSATFGNANAASTTVTLNGPATIRANFTAKPYTVTYYGNGSTGGTPPVDPASPHPHGSTVTVLGNTGNLAKTGFSLAGWNTASNGSGTTYAPGATFTMPQSNVSLYPVWNQLPTANAGPDQNIFLTLDTWSPLPLNPGLWLDASDSQTITTSAGTVSQWADKSGNNRHASQATTANQPGYVATGLNNKGIVRFDGSNDVFAVDLDFLAGVSHSAFIVTKPTVFNNIYGAANGSQGANSLHVGFNGGSYRMNYWGDNFGPARTANFVSGAANIVNYAWTTNTGKEIFANGKSEGTTTYAGLIGTMSGGGRIGSTTDQGYFGGDIAEIIIFPGTLTSQDREKIEGYLAHKWNLQSYLASNHPYKSSPPAPATVTYSATTTLAGSATDPESNPLTTTWSQVSGPSTAEFANVAALNSKVTFTQEGTYTLQLNAHDGSGSATDTVTITVNPPIVYRTLTYDGNGHTGGTAPVDPSSPYADGSTVTALGAGTLTKTGHTFAGWNTAADGSGTAYAANATFTINADTTLYAQWTVNNYTVTFDANGGSTASPSNKQVTYGSPYGTLATTSRTGYSLIGWFTAASGGTQVTAATTVTSTNNHTLYAQWLPDTYTVNYDGNGNTGGNVPANQNKLHDINLTLATNSGGLFKTGYTFTGWNTAANGTGTDYPAGSTYSANAPTTLYAQWGLGTDGTWIQTAAGPFNWGDTANWNNNIVASGADRSALFTPNITAAQTVNLDAATTIGNITFTDSSSSSNDLTISGSNTLTLSRSSGTPVIDVTQSGRTLTISSNIAGANGLQKNGAGKLTLSGANTFSGGVSINAGALQIASAANLGDSANVVTFAGTSTLQFSSNATLSQGFAINAGVTGVLDAYNYTIIINNSLAGSGTLRALNGGDPGRYFEFTGTNNTFSGNIEIYSASGNLYSAGLTMASLADTPGSRIKLGNNNSTAAFTYGAGAVAPLVLNNRQIEHNASNAVLNNNATNVNCTVTVNTDLILSRNANVPFTLGGSNTGNNTFAGIIGDKPGYVTSLTKANAGNWILSNTNNSYTGATTINGGTLSISKIANYGTNSAIGKGTAGSAIVFNTGTLVYTGSGDDTDRLVQVTNNGTILNNGTGALNFTAAGNFNTQASTTSARALTLGGTNGGTISGAIRNNNTGTVSLTKTGTGTWTLSGANTYTGTTTVSAGILQFGKASSLYNGTTGSWTAANIRVANGGTLAFNVGGTGEFTSSDITTLFTNLANSTNATTNGMAAGSNFGFDTTNASGGSFEIPQAITNSGGTAGGARGLTKLGTGTLVLSNANTYTGATTIHGGTLSLTGTTQATTAITFTGGSLGLSTGVTVTASNAAVNLANGTIQVTGTTGAASYTLLTAASITGTPTLASPVPGYELQVVGGNQLRLVQPSLFNTWASTNGLSGGNAASDANPDGDSLTNLQEFAFGMSPTSPGLAPLTYVANGTANPGIPVLENTGTTQSPAYRAVFARRKDHVLAGLTYEVQFSANLTYWKSSSSGISVLSGTSSSDVEAVSLPFPTTVPLTAAETDHAPPKFFRVRVTGTP